MYANKVTNPHSNHKAIGYLEVPCSCTALMEAEHRGCHFRKSPVQREGLAPEEGMLHPVQTYRRRQEETRSPSGEDSS